MTAPADESEMDLETDLDDADNEEAEGGKKKQKMNPKKLAAYIGIGLVGLLVILGPIAYFMGWVHAMLGIQQEKSTALLELGKPVNFELPLIKADLKTGQCKSPFLRARFDVQLSSADVKRIETSQDKLIEQVIMHLRNQERQDLVGKAGADKLRFDLINIVNTVIAPARIHGIIYKEFVLQ
ncbi:MAG: flagellar basal body-associated FliL family protein [Rhodospirillales bacterium]|nr:flagellar basal body-associated FliL family protein [Rhodospirillales bacterium]